MKKSASTPAKGMSNEDNEKNTGTEIINQKYFTCQAKPCPGIKLIFFRAA